MDTDPSPSLLLLLHGMHHYEYVAPNVDISL